MRNYHLLHQAKKKISLCLVLLFNSLDKLQTKPLPPIRHICDFSRGVLNVRFMRSHPTLAPRPQICLIGGNGFCAVAGEDESNRGAGIWGQKLMSSAYLTMTGSRGYDLTCLYVIVKWRNRHFKFDFINIADDNIIITSICLKSSIVSNQ